MMPAPPAGRNAFGDPATGELYQWHRNHEEEQAGARVRAIDNSQPTIGRWKNVRAIRVQAPRDQLVYKLAGRVATLEQHAQFLRFLAMSLEHSIYFFHCGGEKFECLLSDYEPQRVYVSGGMREHYIWVYTIEIDVIDKFE